MGNASITSVTSLRLVLVDSPVEARRYNIVDTPLWIHFCIMFFTILDRSKSVHGPNRNTRRGSLPSGSDPISKPEYDQSSIRHFVLLIWQSWRNTNKQFDLDSEIGRSLQIQNRSCSEIRISLDRKILETYDLILDYEYQSLVEHNSDHHRGSPEDQTLSGFRSCTFARFVPKRSALRFLPDWAEHSVYKQ